MIAMTCGDRPVGGAIRIAATFGSRFAGLMFRKSLPEGSGLLLLPCNSVHMCFMRMALDLVYLDSGFRVLAVQKGLKPWRLGAMIKGARMALELPVGTVDRCGIAPGLILRVKPPVAACGAITDEKRDIHGFETA